MTEVVGCGLERNEIVGRAVARGTIGDLLGNLH